MAIIRWEESARCVLICAAPGVAAGTRCNQPVSLLDIYPTLLEMCHLPAKAGLAGQSFLPQLKDPACKRARPAVTASEKGFSVRTERWRYIWYYDGSEELYDHDIDPMEWDNLAGAALRRSHHRRSADGRPELDLPLGRNLRSHVESHRLSPHRI